MGVRGFGLVVASAFVFVAASALIFTGCQLQRVPVSAGGQPVVQFAPTRQVNGTWTGDIVIADQRVARGLTFTGDGADDLTGGAQVAVAWVPGTMTVTGVQKRSSAWWYAGGVLLYIVAILMEETGRRRMRTADMSTPP